MINYETKRKDYFLRNTKRKTNQNQSNHFVKESFFCNKLNNNSTISNNIPKEVMEQVEKIIEEEHKDYNKDFGYCHIYWQRKKELLSSFGYEWKSPQELNSGISYD